MLLYQRLLAFLNLRKSVKLIFVIQRYAMRLQIPQAPISHTANLSIGISVQFFELGSYNLDRQSYSHRFIVILQPVGRFSQSGVFSPG